MPKPLELTGRVFGMLTAQRPDKSTGRLKWYCTCECGGTSLALGPDLVKGKTASCGCQRNAFRPSHGMSRSSEYRSWNSMWQRCTNENAASHERYKDKAPPERWRSFENFIADMGPKPGPGYSIERLNNDLPYSPENCCWATMAEQGVNRSDNRIIVLDGDSRTLSEWCRHYGVDDATVSGRIRRGWAIDQKVFTTPLYARKAQ